MITGEMRNKVDSIWDTIWTGGITSPITVSQLNFCSDRCFNVANIVFLEHYVLEK